MDINLKGAIFLGTLIIIFFIIKNPNLKQKVRKLFTFWSQFWTVPIGVILFYYSPFLIRYIDPTAESLTIGTLQKFVFLISGMFIIDGLVWLLISLNFPNLFKSYKSKYGSPNSLGDLTPWETRKYKLSLLAIYWLSAVMLVLAAAL